jgi:putative redox protein
MPNHHHISVKHEQNLAFNAQIDHYIVPMDSTDEHSSNHGASPKKMMLAALAGCTGIDVVSILNKMKVEFTDFSIDVDAQLTEEHPVIYDKVSIIYSIRVEEQDRSKMEKAVGLSKGKYCGVSAMFSHFAKVDFKIEFL